MSPGAPRGPRDRGSLTVRRHCRSLTSLGGRPFIENANDAKDGKAQEEMVNYGAKIWVTIATGFPAPSGQTTAQYAQRYRDGVAHGLYKIVGHDQIDGNDVVELRHTVTMTMGPTAARTMTTDIWVDAITYLPVRQRSSMTGMPSGSDVTYDWLPRTPANLARLDLVVPDGFKHQMQTPSSSCSSGGGWLTIHPDNSPVFCSGQILLSHS